MKLFLNILGCVCMPVGAVWLLQGFRIINNGAMAGHRRWILIGGVVFIVGIMILFANNRKKTKLDIDVQ